MYAERSNTSIERHVAHWQDRALSCAREKLAAIYQRMQSIVRWASSGTCSLDKRRQYDVECMFPIDVVPRPSLDKPHTKLYLLSVNIKSV